MSEGLNRRSFLALGGAAAAAALAGCSSTASRTTPEVSPQPSSSAATSLDALLSTLYAAAKKEGKITWYTSTPLDQANAYVSAFQKRWPGVKVALYRAATSPLITKVSQEHSAGRDTADILTCAYPGFAAQFLQSGFIKPYKVYDYDKYGSTARGLADVFELHDYATPYGCIVYNTDKVKKADVPTSWKTVGELDPAMWRGHVICDDPRVYPHTLAYVAWTQTDGRAMPQGLAKLKPTLETSSAPIASGVVSGQYWMSPWFNMQLYQGLAAKGAPIDYIVPEEGIILQAESTFMMTKPPNENAARLFMEFLYSQEGQTTYCSEGAVSGRSDVPPVAGLSWVANTKIVPIDYQKTVTDLDQIVSQAKSDYGLS
jgi:iron(III) transport system substrate-binding protein